MLFFVHIIKFRNPCMITFRTVDGSSGLGSSAFEAFLAFWTRRERFFDRIFTEYCVNLKVNWTSSLHLGTRNIWCTFSQFSNIDFM